MEQLLGDTLLTKEGKKPTSEVLAGKEKVMLYFSAHWCPPCRGFTPTLAAAHEEKFADGKFQIVFVSSDRDEAAFNEYYGSMPWVALPFEDRDRKGELGTKFEIRGIPTLIILNAAGEVIETEGRAKYGEHM